MNKYEEAGITGGEIDALLQEHHEMVMMLREGVRLMKASTQSYIDESLDNHRVKVTTWLRNHMVLPES